MADISGKEKTSRISVAQGRIVMKETTLRLVKEGAIEKGEVLCVAQIAGIQAAKMTPLAIPLCHPVSISHVQVTCSFEESPPSILVRAEVKGHERTGYEVEAMTSAAVALLSIYDMLKPVDDELEIGSIRLEAKSGGKSGRWERPSIEKGKAR
jgi:cyclic pyranopterin phosphate synthase